ncbi:glutaredoxin [Hysterangium stoloniferum]|nr:glutaredoxin [Hysterangium stoloniferum]
MAALDNFNHVESADHFQSLLSKDLQRVSLLNFWAPWAEPCKQMNEIVMELARKYPNILVLQIEAESHPDITESFEIEAVPSFIVLRGHTLLARIPGADAAALTDALATHARSPPTAQAHTNVEPEVEETAEQLEKRLRNLMTQAKVVLFMKGTPDAPRCGFSRKTVALLEEQNVKFTHFDILSDESVRQGLKVLNNWPTFPQIIVDGELIGGLDVLRESLETGEFQEVFLHGP